MNKTRLLISSIIVLHEDATVVILSNTDATGLDEFAAEIGKRIL